MAEIVVNLDKVPKFLDEIAESQLPYACALTLTQIAIKTADHVVAIANMRFNVKNKKYLKNATHAKIGEPPSPSRAINAMPADKHDGLSRMKSTVGVIHWGIADLIDGKMDTRGTLTAKYRWVPLKGRKLGYGMENAYPGQGNKSKGNFFMKSKRGNHLLVTRAGKSRKLTPMFLRKKTQNMRPILNLEQICNHYYPKYWDLYFQNNLDAAIRTAKWPK